jgi:integrase
VDEGEPDEAQLNARGVSFPARGRADAVAVFRDLQHAARSAVAQGEVAQFLDALDSRERQRPGSGQTFSAFAREWFRTCVAPESRESGVETDRSILDNHLVPFFGTSRLGEIDARMIDRYKAQKRQQKHQYGSGYSAHAVNNHLSVLRRIMEKAVEYGHVAANPIRPTTWLKRETTPEESRAWWTPAEEAKAMAHLRTIWRVGRPERYMPLLVQLMVGMRFGEVRALEKRDLDLTALPS